MTHQSNTTNPIDFPKRQDMDAEGQLLIDLGRAERRLHKARKQRDFYKQRLEYYQKVLTLQPYIEKRWKNYEERCKELQRVKDLEARVKEQALLIKELTK